MLSLNHSRNPLQFPLIKELDWLYTFCQLQPRSHTCSAQQWLRHTTDSQPWPSWGISAYQWVRMAPRSLASWWSGAVWPAAGLADHRCPAVRKKTRRGLAINPVAYIKRTNRCGYFFSPFPLLPFLPNPTEYNYCSPPCSHISCMISREGVKSSSWTLAFSLLLRELQVKAVSWGREQFDLGFKRGRVSFCNLTHGEIRQLLSRKTNKDTSNVKFCEHETFAELTPWRLLSKFAP